MSFQYNKILVISKIMTIIYTWRAEAVTFFTKLISFSFIAFFLRILKVWRSNLNNKRFCIRTFIQSNIYNYLIYVYLFPFNSLMFTIIKNKIYEKIMHCGCTLFKYWWHQFCSDIPFRIKSTCKSIKTFHFLYFYQ